jgi:signal transduction histidine kinase
VKESNKKLVNLFRSLLRIVPAALIGLIPMSGLDTIILERSYSLRGARELPSNVYVLRVDPKEAPFLVPQALANLQPRHCVLIQIEKAGSHYCQSLDLSQQFSLNSLIDLESKFQSWFHPNEFKPTRSYEPYYYGPIDNIPLYSGNRKFERSLSQDNGLLVILATEPLPPFAFDTPVGRLSSHEVVINILSNVLNKDFLERGSYGLQVLISFGLVLAFAAFMTQFPIWLSGIVLIGTNLCYFVVSLILLDQSHFSLPLAAPLLALALSYLLGMTDQLERQEKKQWSLERETEFLREIDNLKNHFLSLVSHDLKTPIARIQSLLEQLLHSHSDQKLSPEQNQLIEKTLRANAQLQRSIGTLLLLNRIESRDFQIQRHPTDMSQLITDCLSSSRELAQEKGIEIITELETLFLVELDSTLIREVIYNLIDNAIKYSPENGKIIVRCGESEVLSELTPPQAGIWFEVQDSGPGIDPADRKRILQKSFSTDSKKIPPTQSIKGSGLGLYLSAFFVERHRGHVTILSRCVGETLSSDDPAQEYFPESSHGTLVRVALPVDSLYIESAHETESPHR